MDRLRRNELAWYFSIKHLVNKPVWVLGEIEIDVKRILNTSDGYELHCFCTELCIATIYSANPHLPFGGVEKLPTHRRNELAWKVFVQLVKDGEATAEPASQHMEKGGEIKPPTMEEKRLFMLAIKSER